MLKQYDKSIIQAGFSNTSKAIQASLREFVDENEWKGAENQSGAGVVFMLYDNHTYNQDRESIHAQHEYADIISASTHVHLDHHNCLETIMVKGQVKKIRELVKVLSQNRGIKSLKLHFVTLV